ncbi:MAG TPA: amidase domain-containing protein [Pirellulales bacterium]|jgi:cell wall-associated NlpC family hydrolase|nr:amidase domain-containing protein [Pirellulales bacterium]
MGYRSDTMDYVKKFWFRPCHDHVFMTKNGAINSDKVKHDFARKGLLPDPDKWYAVFIPDLSEKSQPAEQACFIRPDPAGVPILAKVPSSEPLLTGTFDIVQFHKDKGLVDCANFVSHCMHAGGKKFPGQTGVPELVSVLRKRSDTKTLGEQVDVNIGERILTSGIFKPGDLIAFHKDTGKEKGFTHSAIYIGAKKGAGDLAGSTRDHLIACHTVSRFGRDFRNDVWHLGGPNGDPSFSYTFIHYVDDDPTFPPIDEMWTQVNVVGKPPVFYHFDRGGAIQRTNLNPTSKNLHIRKDDHGYWYSLHTNLTIFWPNQKEVAGISGLAALKAIFTGEGSIPIFINGNRGSMTVL